MEVTSVERASRYKVTVVFDDNSVITIKRREAEDYGLLPGAFLTDEAFEKLYKEILLPGAKKKAMDLLLAMDRTEGELREKLLSAGFGAKAAEEAILYVKKYGYVDDERYKKLYVENRSDRKSPMEIAAGLMRKGVSGAEARAAVKDYYTAEREAETACELLKKRHFDPFEEDYKKKQKHISYLARKGFSFSAIHDAEDRLKEEAEEK